MGTTITLDCRLAFCGQKKVEDLTRDNRSNTLRHERMSLWNKELRRKDWAGNGLWQGEEFGFEFTGRILFLEVYKMIL